MSSRAESRSNSPYSNGKNQSIRTEKSQDQPPDRGETSDVEEQQKDNQATTDGGLRAWLRVLGAFLILANTMGLQSSFGVFEGFYKESILQDYSAYVISWIGTFQIFCTASGSLVSGPLFDLGFDKYTVILGCFFAVLAYMMTSLSTAYYQIFLAQGVAGGPAGAFVFAPCVALTAISFQKRKSFAVGLATSGFVFGAVIYPIVFRKLQPMIGFPWTTRVMAFMALGCFLVAYPLVYWKTPRAGGKIRKVFDLKAWKEPAYATYGWGVFFMYAGYWPPYIYIISYASKGLGTSVTMAVYVFAIANAANVIARLSATLIADKFGIIEVLTSATFISSVIAFCWPAVSSTAGVIVWSVFWGYFSGIMSGLFAAIVPSLSPDASVVGTRLGMINGLFGIGALISPPIAGAIQGNKYGKASDYLGMQMWVAACLIVATVLFIYPLIYLRRERKQQAKAAS